MMQVSYVYYNCLEIYVSILLLQTFLVGFSFLLLVNDQDSCYYGWCIAMITNVFQSGDSVALLLEELSKQDVELKRRDQKVTLLKVRRVKLLKAYTDQKKLVEHNVKIYQASQRKYNKLSRTPRSAVLPPNLYWPTKIMNFKCFKEDSNSLELTLADKGNEL